jgi:hypothetical protein
MKTPSIKKGIYKHYRGDLYEVVGVANHSETLEPMVIYKALYHSDEFGTNALWARPYSMFLETVVIEGVEQPRFQFVSTDTEIKS